MMMAEYTLRVTTGAKKHAGTIDHVYVILFGTEGQSERTNLDNFGIDFRTGMASSRLLGNFQTGLSGFLSFPCQNRHMHL